MWLLLLFLYSAVVESYAIFEEDVDEKLWNCTLPAFPKNGYYHIIGIGGTRIYTTDVPKPTLKYEIEYYCNKGYGSIGLNVQYCYQDGHTEYADFECLPYCKLDSKPTVLSCSAESRCVAAQTILQDIVPRVGVNDSGSGGDLFADCGYITDPGKPLGIGYEVEPGGFFNFNRVTGGRPAHRNEFPWHVGVYSKKTRPYMQICGGSLVSSAVVITAAHCFWDEKEEKQMPATNYAVAVGKLFRPWNDTHDVGAQTSDVAEIRLTPYFKGHTTHLQDDIALVILKSPFIFSASSRPVCLDFSPDMDLKQLAPRKLGTVPGWGLTGEDGFAAPILQVANFPVLNISECFGQSDKTFLPHITSDKFCAGWKNGTAVCRGDSGGGLIFPEWSNGKKRFYLRGVVSGAPQNEHLCNVYSWASFTRVSKHERFIKDTLLEVNATLTTHS